MALEEDLVDMFNMLDTNNSGGLEIQEFGMALRALGLNPSDAIVESLFERADINGDGKIEYSEFERMFNRCEKKDKVSKESLEEHLQPLDLEGSGFLEANDLYDILCNGGEPLTRREVRKVIRDFDPEGTGKIPLEEFIEGLLSVDYS